MNQGRTAGFSSDVPAEESIFFAKEDFCRSKHGFIGRIPESNSTPNILSSSIFVTKKGAATCPSIKYNPPNSTNLHLASKGSLYEC